MLYIRHSARVVLYVKGDDFEFELISLLLSVLLHAYSHTYSIFSLNVYGHLYTRKAGKQTITIVLVIVSWCFQCDCVVVCTVQTEPPNEFEWLKCAISCAWISLSLTPSHGKLYEAHVALYSWSEKRCRMWKRNQLQNGEIEMYSLPKCFTACWNLR